MSSSSSHSTKKPSIIWWLFGIIIFLVSMLIQLPASWLLKRAAPQQTIVETVSGSLWRGQAQWKLPAQLTRNKQPIVGLVSWQWRPWELLWLQGGADVIFRTGDTKLSGRLGITKSTWHVKNLSGKVASHTLKQTLPLTWPDTAINLTDVSLKNTYNSKNADWEVAKGMINWAGGDVGYTMGGKLTTASLPEMQAKLSLEEKKLHIALTNGKDERMGDIYLDNEKMVDVQLTQRLLLTVKGYKGNAAPDTTVVSVRQPLATLGK